MRRLLSRTSITIDEAVSILLLRTTGPVDLAPIDGADEADVDIPAFCLKEALEDELDVLDGEYRSAKHDEQPEHVIAERLAALQRQEALIEQANLYLCAIQDELNKGEQSMLKVDRALSNSTYTFITLHSFNEWVKSSSDDQSSEAARATSVTASAEGKKEVLRNKLIQQEDAILAEIRKQDSDPLALPRNEPGRRGVKFDVCRSLDGRPPFDAKSAFKAAWDRLRKDGRMVDQADPTPYKKSVRETS